MLRFYIFLKKWTYVPCGMWSQLFIQLKKKQVLSHVDCGIVSGWIPVVLRRRGACCSMKGRSSNSVWGEQIQKLADFKGGIMHRGLSRD